MLFIIILVTPAAAWFVIDQCGHGVLAHNNPRNDKLCRLT